MFAAFFPTAFDLKYVKNTTLYKNSGIHGRKKYKRLLPLKCPDNETELMRIKDMFTDFLCTAE